MGRFFPDECTPLRKWMYRVDRFSGNEERFAEVYETKNAEIREYFQDRPGDFLEMDLAAGDGWLKLVNFLGPDFLPPFPKEKAGGSYEARNAKRRKSKLGRFFR